MNSRPARVHHPLRRLRAWPCALALALLPAAVPAQPGDDTVLQAREALRKKDRVALSAARQAVSAQRHPLAPWVEYWELSSRLNEAQATEVDAFFARWTGSYVEDRLRNDWLLELGKRRDWPRLRAEHPRFRMNDDREVACYALLAAHLDGQDVRAAARAAWVAQREPDDGCALMARTLFEARVLVADDAWHAARVAVEANRLTLARAAVALADPRGGAAAAQALDDPVRWLRLHPTGHADLALLALMRMAASDPEFAAGRLQGDTRLPQPLLATAWAHVAKQGALKQLPGAAEWARRAWQLWDSGHKHAGAQPPWSDDLLAWHVRAALRPTAGATPRRWELVQRAVAAMSPAEQRDPAWIYWTAHATQALARPGDEGNAARAAAQSALESIAQLPGFYGLLAAEELGRAFALPPAPASLTAAERDAARSQPGLARALQLVALGLRNEGVREWNYTLRGMGERDLLAAAQWACERAVWDRCINTSERTRAEIDVAQRYPMPYRDRVVARATETGLDAALLFGLIRQESRFVVDVRSSVGATGLMQLMPDTARWTARQVGLPWRPEMIGDPDVNLGLGAAYLKRVLDDFGGSATLATAGYNAGPGRPRRWREAGGTLEPAAWAETIPFNETRDYVKKVLSNSVFYAALLGAPAPSLKARLGAPIGPRDPAAAAPDRGLP